jgi:glyoxylase-like metal-dependent hydrolase (beta-lactamase superfamily II)
MVPVTAFQQNCSIHWCPETREAVVVDPGGEAERILQALDEENLVPAKILLTHGHLDHVGAAQELARRLAVPIWGPQADDLYWFQCLDRQARKYGFPPIVPFEPDRWLQQGDTVEFGGLSLEVLHCPGHTPGHVVFFHRGEGLALVGDVLFAGSIGRTDLPGGDHAVLLGSIRQRLWPLGDSVRFLPGHGPMSSFAEERRNNPFVADRLAAV